MKQYLQKIYLDYSQEELDKQYDQASLVSNIDHYIKLDSLESAKIRDQYSHASNIHYGNGPDEVLDLFAPENAIKCSTIVYFHGGAWKLLSKEHASFPAPTFIQQNCLYISVNFSLVPNVSLDQLITQCKNALIWIRNNIEQYGGDANKIYVAGHSSGAHIAALMLGAFNWILGGLLVSGIYDLEPVRLSSRNSYLCLTEHEAYQLSPIHKIQKSMPPIVIAYSKNELMEFQRQSEHFSSAWKEMGNKCSLVSYSDLNHFEMLHELKNPSTQYLQTFGHLLG